MPVFSDIYYTCATKIHSLKVSSDVWVSDETLFQVCDVASQADR